MKRIATKLMSLCNAEPIPKLRNLVAQRPRALISKAFGGMFMDLHVILP